jgi:hypothetical protein
MMRVFVLSSLLLVAVSAQSAGDEVVTDFDESFTIFLDLSDYHVSKDGSHEFLTHDHIGEHDNVIVHMSEDEMKMHMANHDTHDCQPPVAQEEIVSFIQEAMWSTPSEPNFIDDAINANYAQTGIAAWDSQLATPQMGAVNPLQQPIQPPTYVAPPKETKAQKKAAPASPEKSVADKAKTAAKADEKQPEKVVEEKKTIDEDEEAAVARFRDAYHAMKYADHGSAPASDVESKATAKALESEKKQVTEETKKAASLFDSLFDADDKAAMGLFGGERTDLPEDAFNVKDFNMGNVLDKIVDEALHEKTNPEIVDVSSPVGTVEPEAKKEKKEDKVFVEEPKEEKKETEQDVNIEKLSKDEQETLKILMKKLGSATPAEAEKVEKEEEKKEEEKSPAAKETKETVNEKNLEVKESVEKNSAKEKITEEKKDETITAEKKVEEQKDETTTSEKKLRPLTKVEALQKSVIEEEEEEAVRLAPGSGGLAGDLATPEVSHIGLAPKAKDFIPESVYAQESVSFDEMPKLIQKHAPKRILIPRMEEPGPVIGGGSRPVHIMLPPPDDTPKVGSSRPAAPVQAQIRAAFPPSAITDNNQQQQPASNKVTTLASANDEALSAAEVIIF